MYMPGQTWRLREPSVLAVIGDVLADQGEQMPLPEHDDVIEQFAA
jgi:hypothetical protein